MTTEGHRYHVSACIALKDVKSTPSSYLWASFFFLCILKRNACIYMTAYRFFAASLSLFLVQPRRQRVPTRKAQSASTYVCLFVVVAFAGVEDYTIWKGWLSYRNSRWHSAYFQLHLKSNRIEKSHGYHFWKKRSVRHNGHLVSCLYKLLQRKDVRAFSKNESSALLHDSLDLWAYVIWCCQWNGLTRKQQL